MQRNQSPNPRNPKAKADADAVAAATVEEGATDWASAGWPFPEEIIQAARSQRDDGVVLFWKDHENNGYLSNWATSTMEIEGERYNCVEQWIMSNKVCTLVPAIS